jgi:Domain of unknown function (DUF4335)
MVKSIKKLILKIKIMESPNLKTRTYTAPTCELIVSDPGSHQPSFDASGEKIRKSPDHLNKFTLHLEQHDLGEQDRVVLHGQPQQLTQLQQVVNKYVAELVAKFPLQNINDQVELEPVILPLGEVSPPIEIDTVAASSVSDQLYPSAPSAFNSGLMNNLPGLRNNLAETPAAPTEATGVSKFFGLWNKADQDRDVRAAAAKQTSPAVENPAPTTPYLTASSRSVDRQLHHQLHLGNLATPRSGAVLSLSAIQLFDLATVLDEYAAATVQTIHQPKPTTLSRANIPGVNTSAADPTTIPLSRLPNLPKIPAGAENSQVYRQTRRANSASSLMSTIPWVAAAAVAVGLPLLLFDPKPNPLKDATSKVKMPDLASVQKTIGTAFSPEQVDKPTPNSTASTPNPALPAPWQAQPVQPPKLIDKPIDPSLQPTPTTTTIGLAPLPESIVGKPRQDRSLGTNLSPNELSGIAPNPLNSGQLPAGTVSSTGVPATNSQPTPISKSPVASRPNPAVPAKPAKSTATKPAKPSTITTDNVSISKQPFSLPADLPTGGINPPIPQLPLNREPVVPKVSKPQTSKQTPKQKFTPTEIAKTPKPVAVKQNPINVAPQPTLEPFITPVPTNPNIVNPEPQSSGDLIEPQTQPLGPNRPLQSNVGGISGPDPNDTPSLQETKRYFQDKWKANPNQSNPLQYVLQVSGKTGIVRSISPQGEAATTYLQESKLIKPGQKLVSPAAAGTSDQKIRVLLQPDGNVDTFMEP